jgi:hypothetical protein
VVLNLANVVYLQYLLSLSRFFKVFDKSSGKHIASFFLDPYSRPEDKRGGAWMDVCIGKSEAVNRDVPVAYLVCNGSPPVGQKPSLMTFNEVETLVRGQKDSLKECVAACTGLFSLESLNAFVNSSTNLGTVSSTCSLLRLLVTFLESMEWNGMPLSFYRSSWKSGTW